MGAPLRTVRVLSSSNAIHAGAHCLMVIRNSNSKQAHQCASFAHRGGQKRARKAHAKPLRFGCGAGLGDS